MLWPLYSNKKTPAAIEQKAVWAPELV